MKAAIWHCDGFRLQLDIKIWGFKPLANRVLTAWHGDLCRTSSGPWGFLSGWGCVCPCTRVSTFVHVPWKEGFSPCCSAVSDSTSLAAEFMTKDCEAVGTEVGWIPKCVPPKNCTHSFCHFFLLGGHHRIFALSGLCLYGTRMESWWGDLCLLAQEEFYHVVSDLKSHMLEGGQDVTFWAVKRLFFRA